MKTQDELLEHYWSVIVPMARNHGVKPWECVRYCGDEILIKNHPKFNEPEEYTLAIAILEGKPVFVGDTLWNKVQIIETVFEELDDHQRIVEENYSWTPPAKKRTFVLNGVELPCPIQNSIGCRLDFLGVDYHFETVQDRNKVANAISNILNQSETRSKQNVL